ncbi:MAG TPA: type II toxin-antitoxin system RelE/ParE family toxin [Candidatus Limnocylindria bacterium]
MTDQFHVVLLPAARRQLEKLTPAIQHRLTTAMARLGGNPWPSGAQRLKGPDDVFRIRVGEYRVLYRVIGDRLLVLVIRVGHRREVYRAAALRRLRS